MANNINLKTEDFEAYFVAMNTMIMNIAASLEANANAYNYFKGDDVQGEDAQIIKDLSETHHKNTEEFVTYLSDTKAVMERLANVTSETAAIYKRVVSDNMEDMVSKFSKVKTKKQ